MSREPLRIQIRCDEGTYERWKKVAKRYGVSYEELINALLNMAEMDRNDLSEVVDELRERKHTRRREERR